MHLCRVIQFHRGGTTHLSGRRSGADWRLPSLKDKTLSPEDEDLLLRAMEELRTPHLYVPRPFSCNAEISDPSEYSALKVGDGIVHYGRYEDGIIIDPRRHSESVSVLVRSGDCHTLSLTNERGVTGILHCARWSLLDQGMILRGTLSREHESAVFALLSAMDSDPRDLVAQIVLGIAPENFPHPADHPEHGTSNERLVRYLSAEASWKNGYTLVRGDLYRDGFVDLPAIIEAQLVSCGVLPENISWDKRDTYSDHSFSSEPRWHSHARGDRERNGVFVKVAG